MKQLYRLIFIVLGLILELIVGGRQTAVSAQPSNPFLDSSFSGAQWVIIVTIENSQPQFDWHVTVSGLPGTATKHSQTPLNCTIDPDVVVRADHLSFLGNGAIHCPIPSFADEVAWLTNGAVRLPSQVTIEHFYVEADLTLAAPTATDQTMSIFSHPDFHYGTTIFGQPAASSLGIPGKGQQHVAGGLTMTTTSQISVTPLTTTLGIYKQPDGFQHRQDNTLLAAQTVGNKFAVGTGTTTVCIGCGPDGYFVGIMWYAELDPGCTGICGVG